VTASSERHLSADSFAAYLHSGAPIEHPLPGPPRLHLFIDPHRVRIGLRGPAGPREVPVATGLEHVTVRAVHHDQQRMIEIEISDARLFTDAYPVLCAVADRVQLDRKSITAALTETLRRLGHLLRPHGALARETEIGLLGELSILAGLARTIGPEAGLDSWRGGHGEEHDFGLSEHDIEVKTTTSERRAHWIASLTQLEPTGERPLWLVSYQVTGAGSDGRTLPDLIDRVRTLFPGAVEGDRFDSRLREAGWHDRYAATCHHRWRLRTTPAAFAVTTRFPRLSARLLETAGVDLARVTDARYRLDLNGWPVDELPAPLDAALATAQLELR